MPRPLLEQLTSLPAQFVTADEKRLSPLAYVFLFLLCLAFFAPGLATLPPTDRDESSFAQASKQMIESGNYVDIRLQDKPRYQKPIGIYWLQTTSVRLLNAAHLNEIWAYRIPSLLGATTAVLMTAALGSLFFGPMAGLLAAMMMAGCVILNVEARLAKTDAALLGSIMVMQYAMARVYLGSGGWRLSLTFWTALGLGILIKGPIILLILFSTLFWLHITHRHLKWFWALKPFAGLPYVLLLIVPWFIAIMAESHGNFATQSAGHDLFAKLWQGQNRGIMPPGLHLLAFPLMFFPFALLAQLAVPDIWKDRREAAVAFCLGWIIPTWIVFELSLTKLPHYTLPTYPAIAMLTAKALLDGYPTLAQKNWRWLLAAAVGLWLTIGTGFAVLFALLPYITDHTWNSGALAAGVLLMVAQGAGLFLLVQRKPNCVIILAAGSLCFMAATFGHTLPSLQHLWVTRQAVQMAAAIQPCHERPSIISASYGEPSLLFTAGTDTEIVADGREAASLLQNNPCKVALIDNEHQQAFIDFYAHTIDQPQMMGKVEGLNIGHGHDTELTLYIAPPRVKAP